MLDFPDRKKILKQSEVLEIASFSRTTLWRRVGTGEFPAPVKLGGAKTRRVGWKVKDVIEWLDGLS